MANDIDSTCTEHQGFLYRWKHFTKGISLKMIPVALGKTFLQSVAITLNIDHIIVNFNELLNTSDRL